MSPKPVNDFVFSPLPTEILALAAKFPVLDNTFKGLGIKKFSDLGKISQAQLYLPGLTRTVGIKNISTDVGKFALPSGVPLSGLSSEAKKSIPTDVVFPRAAGSLVDFKIALAISDQGKVEQKINTISGQALDLAVKPDFPARSVKGYVLFKSRATGAKDYWDIPSWISQAFGVEVAQAATPNVNFKDKLVLMSFDYTDPDKDGIYTAAIQVPIPAGEYEILTVVEYQDENKGTHALRLIAVVDPEGYVYELVSGKELRVPDAKVSLYYLNSASRQFDLWPAPNYQQTNPQTTEKRGSYSFLVPSGLYYLKVEAQGYQTYESDQFKVEEGAGIHNNIQLKPVGAWWKALDWKAVLLIAITALLLYNFYRDKKREKH